MITTIKANLHQLRTLPTFSVTARPAYSSGATQSPFNQFASLPSSPSMFDGVRELSAIIEYSVFHLGHWQSIFGLPRPSAKKILFFIPSFKHTDLIQWVPKKNIS